MRERVLREDQVRVIARELYHGHSLRENEVTLDEVTEAGEAADRLIELAGFDLADSDNWGADMGSTVKLLLETVMMRVPQLRERLLAEEVILDDRL